MKKAKLEITCKSDICVASGYSFAGVIDTDICYDSFGIPYIPARRIKGCLRETAESVLHSIISKDDIIELFGCRGNNGVKGIFVSNAYIENYPEIRKEAETLVKDKAIMINEQKILNQFSHIQAQTELDDEGVIIDNTLRFTRVVKQYSPVNEKELVFLADITYDEALEEKLIKLVKGTRNIGLKRNRGLGSVKIELKEAQLIEEGKSMIGQGDDIIEIDYVIQNDAPLMVSESNDGQSLNHILGQSVLGMLAGKYLALKGKTAEDPEFIDLFLNGSTKYTDAFPYNNGRTYYPAPLYINSLKKTKDFVDVYLLEKNKTITENGNLPKKLTGKYVAMNTDDSTLSVKEVEKKIVYHHTHKGRKKGEERADILYTFEAVEAGHCYAGKIITKKKYGELLSQLLKDGEFRFGKSKTAEYGLCSLVDIKTSEVAEPIKIEAGNIVRLVFRTNAAFINDSNYTVFKDQITEIVKTQLGIKGSLSEEFPPILQTKLLHGYLGIWNLRKTPIPVIEAGSVICYKLDENLETSELTFVGERNLEGLGMVSIDVINPNIDCLFKKEKTNDDELSIQIKELKTVVKRIIRSDLAQEIGLIALKTDNIGISKAKLGRLTLMLQESMDENKENPKAAWASLIKRVNSIKTTEDKEEIQRNFINKIYSDLDSDFTPKGYQELESWKLMDKLKFTEEEKTELLNSLLCEYALQILINQKYKNSKGDK